MSRRFARVLVTAIASLMMVAGLPAASHADTTILKTTNSNDVDTRLTAPAGISAWSTALFNNGPSGPEASITLVNTSRRTMKLKATALTYTVSNATNSAPFAASALNNRVFILPPSSTMQVTVGAFDYVVWGHIEDLTLLTFTPSDAWLDLTLSEVSTFDWAPARTALIAQGLSPSATGVVRVNSFDANGDVDIFDQQGLFLPTCNNTSENKYIRIEEALIGGVHVAEAKKVISISANSCSDVWLGNPQNLYGRDGLLVDIIFGSLYKANYSEIDNILDYYKIRRVSPLRLEKFITTNGLEDQRLVVDICLKSGATVKQLINVNVTYEYDTGFGWIPWVQQQTNAVSIPSLLKAKCNLNRSTTLTVMNQNLTYIDLAQLHDPAFEIGLSISIFGDDYTGPIPLDSTFDYSAARAILNDSGLRAGAPASPLFDEATGWYWLRMHACNDTNVNRNVWMYAFTLDGVRTVLNEPVFGSIPGGTCSYIKLGYITNANDNFTNGLVTPEFMPRLAISSSGFDAKLRTAGLRRVGQFSVFDGADTPNTMSVFVPVCSNSGKERKIYVGASTITATFHTWTDGNQEVQTIPGTCSAGGNLMTIGTYDTSDVTLRDLSEYLSLDTPQLITATPSRVMQVGVMLPAGIQMETLASDLKFVPGVAPSVGETEVWAKVNVPLADKAKRYSVNSLQIGGTSFNNPVTVAGACATVTIAKKKYCQRKVKLANVPNNWIYGKTLNVSGRVGPLALRTR